MGAVNADPAQELAPLLAALARHGALLALDEGGQLSLSAARGGLPAELLARVREHKALLQARLRDDARARAAGALPVITPDIPGPWRALRPGRPAGGLHGLHEQQQAQKTPGRAPCPQAWHSASFDLLPAVQRERRAAANRSQAPLPDGLLHDGLAYSAARWPSKTAVIDPWCTLPRAG